MAVAAATGGTRAPAVREDTSRGRRVADGWPRKQRRDFERGSVVEVVVAEVVGAEGGKRKRMRRRKRRHSLVEEKVARDREREQR